MNKQAVRVGEGSRPDRRAGQSVRAVPYFRADRALLGLCPRGLSRTTRERQVRGDDPVGRARRSRGPCGRIVLSSTLRDACEPALQDDTMIPRCRGRRVPDSARVGISAFASSAVTFDSSSRPSRRGASMRPRAKQRAEVVRVEVGALRVIPLQSRSIIRHQRSSPQRAALERVTIIAFLQTRWHSSKPANGSSGAR